MFLMGFVQMIRGADSPVRLTWVTDEIGRFDPNNLGAFLQTLDAHRIDVISASPSVDPALARFFRGCVFLRTRARLPRRKFQRRILSRDDAAGTGVSHA